MNIPLINRLNKRSQRDIALLEDVLIRIIYEIDNTAEVHGGTAIWRCYGGRRFSKDIDIYIRSKEHLEAFRLRIQKTAQKYGTEVLKLKDTGNLIFMELLLGDIYSEIDINYKKYYADPVLKRYENTDGTFFEILTLPPEILIQEKIDAYKDREYITDLYDIGLLVDYADIGIVGLQLRQFMSSVNAPKDLEKEEMRLKTLIYEGPVPTFESLINSIRGRIG